MSEPACGCDYCAEVDGRISREGFMLSLARVERLEHRTRKHAHESLFRYGSPRLRKRLAELREIRTDLLEDFASRAGSLDQ